MEKLLIKGGKKLKGKIRIGGAKNAAVAILPAAILSNDICCIDNLPNINDVRQLKNILLDLGAEVKQDHYSKMKIDATTINNVEALGERPRSMRASYYFLGALLGRFKKAAVSLPGGCNIGVRPIDQHIKGFEALGAKVTIEHGIVYAEADQLIGAPIFLDVVSVGATINIMLAASRAKGITTIENAAKEPHVVDVANFLNSMGADIKGAGTDVIRIKGVDQMHGSEYSVIPDQIEAGTYMLAAAATKGNVFIENVIPKHLESITAKLEEMGVQVEKYDDSIRIVGKDHLKRVNIKTQPYPGFPTDLQQPMTVLLSIADGTSIVTESIWENRFLHVDELKRMGANIKVEGRTAIIYGVKKLLGAEVKATDLRAGAAMVIAGLIAEGETLVGNLIHIDRGYEELEEKMNSLGADIRRIEV
ncbi:UDP-N-acetylglucosamine 1-carboxyvinyltransferase [Garciella nitratireducens]|uniref:UDP-N-acetylglucosamine 1-carboxyvinyltransferase n=1 Tax=Garciella nitratireducens DSM 15102 TaxID=1121911 RepID=A0A1T4M761_9FIRM|nr:UDP-N-acetylglucosamine 1-carboxyvinyltransferase [Garciella nitratireducens]SJZ62564.1 UDP-N-acetylglucosamine 1-carboxyvinyltransferase [Garciella nitratireducens DSM 15102]